METKHTPGPWVATTSSVHPELHLIWTEVDESTNVSMLVARTCFAPASEANARLIAAAPELLEAVGNLPKWLREAAESLEFQANQRGATNALTPKMNWYADKIEKAIAKATGEKEVQP